MYLLLSGIVALLGAVCLTWGVAIWASFSRRL